MLKLKVDKKTMLLEAEAGRSHKWLVASLAQVAGSKVQTACAFSGHGAVLFYWSDCPGLLLDKQTMKGLAERRGLVFLEEVTHAVGRAPGRKLMSGVCRARFGPTLYYWVE